MLFLRGREKRGPVLALLGIGVYAHVCMMAMCFVRLRLFVIASSDDHGMICISERCHWSLLSMFCVPGGFNEWR